MLSFKDFLHEGDVVPFPGNKARKSKESSDSPNEHVRLEQNLERQIHDTPHDHKKIQSHFQPLFRHLNDKFKISLMSHKSYSDEAKMGKDLVTLSKGVRQASDAGTSFSPHKGYHAGFQVYMNSSHSHGFEDGYGGNGGIRIKSGATPEHISDFLKQHLPSHFNKLANERS